MEKCKRKSNWVDLRSDPPDLDPSSGSSWQVIHAMQETFRHANDIHECLALFPARRELLVEDEDLGYLLGLVHDLESRSPFSHGQDWLKIINAKLTLARYLLEADRLEELSAQLDHVEVTLKDLSWIQESDAPWLWLRKLQIASRDPRNMENLPARLNLAALMQEHGDTLQETSVLLDIHLILNEVDGLKRDSSWVSLNAANLQRFDEIDSSLGNALSVSHNISRFGKTDDTTTTASEYLHRLRLFESRYTQFDVPLDLFFLYRAASDAARKLASEDCSDYEAKVSAAWANCPTDAALQNCHYREKEPQYWPLEFFVTLHQWMQLDYDKGSMSDLNVAELLLLDTASGSLQQLVNQTLAADFGPDQSRDLTDRMYGANDFVDLVDAITWERRFRSYEEWLWNCPVEIDRSLRHTILLDMQVVRDTKLREYHANTISSKDLVDHDLQLDLHLLRRTERLRLADLRKRVDRKAIGANQIGTLSDEWHLMSLKSTLVHSVKAVHNGLLKDSDLHEVQTWMDQAYREAPIYFKKQRLITLSNMAQAMQSRYNVFGTIAPDAPLEAYARYDEIYVGIRRERSVLRGSTNLSARAHISPDFGGSDHYLKAMACCVESLGPARVQARWQRIMGRGQQVSPISTPLSQRSKVSLMDELISWAQKRKARSVAEVIGAEIIIPQRNLAALNNDEGAMSLLRKEAELQTTLDSGASDPIESSKQLEQVRKEMRDCSSLEQVMNLRDGVAMTRAQIQAMSQVLGPHAVIVDYIYIPSSSTAVPNELICMVYKNGVHHSSNWVTADLDYAGLRQWVKDVFFEEYEPLSTDEADEHLGSLYALIADAVNATEPGDIILLCPTSELFKIPLHAIPVEDKPLIERNPVVYTQSLTILYICAISASSVDPDSSANPVAVQALSDFESASIAIPTMAFAEKIGARLLSGSDLTKSSFLEAITQSSLINFYGHVCFDESRPLEHYMAIRGIDSERVTARELFDIRLRSGAHINMIGCKSGVAEVRANDDQLGLSTALLYAGAGSILSTLWEIRMEDALEFQEAFYDEFLVQLSEESRQRASEGGVDAEQFVDLAKALQKAMVKASKYEDGTRKAPYHWAAFMLQGDWKALPILSFH